VKVSLEALATLYSRQRALSVYNINLYAIVELCKLWCITCVKFYYSYLLLMYLKAKLCQQHCLM